MTNPRKEPWAHAPSHWLFEPGIYMVTAGTFQRQHLLNTPERLDVFQRLLFSVAREQGWKLQAWAILSNHYHLIAASPRDGASTLSQMLGKLHMLSAKDLNRQDDAPGRRAWYQFWESQITFQPSHLARLNYVHYNPVHHGVATDATTYRWCSAARFEQKAPATFVKTVKQFKTDRVRVIDDF